MNTEDLAAVRARAELAIRQGEVGVIEIVLTQDVPRLIAEVEALSDPLAEASDVAQELIQVAGQTGDVQTRSVLLAASRSVDQVIMQNMRMARRVEGLTEVVDASLLVEMALIDEREKVARVEAVLVELEEDGVFPATRLAAERVRKALAVPSEESEEEGAQQ